MMAFAIARCVRLLGVTALQTLFTHFLFARSR